MRYVALLLGGLACASFLPPARAQSTDGYHVIQVFPIVVNTGSFAQSFVFANGRPGSATVTPRYFPADGTSATSMTCPDFTITEQTRSFQSLLELCPALPAGSQFGSLVLTSHVAGADYGAGHPFSGFSRVSNPQGNGFSVEAFPAHTFTMGYASVPGLRRRSATPTSPAFQTNCFIGQIGALGGAGHPVQVQMSLTDAQGGTINTDMLNLAPGKLVRLLDVFAYFNAPQGDYEDAVFRFGPMGAPDHPGLLGFCTVQDNTSFGADFRIAKAGLNLGGESSDWTSPGDNHVNRVSSTRQDMVLPGESDGRWYGLEPGQQNSHVFYFRHPDAVACRLYSQGFGRALTPADGLEMRLVDRLGNVVAGGDGVAGFGQVFMGDKESRGQGFNTRYAIQVENTKPPGGTYVAYSVECESGSGHTPGDLTRYQAPLDEF